MTKDMTVGSTTKLLLRFSIPVIFGYMFQQVYTLVDTVIVGQLLGVKALAGVGATGGLSFLVIGFCCGLCEGFAIPVAQNFGAKNYQNMRRHMAGAVYLGVIFSILLTAVSVYWCHDILVLLDTPKDIFALAYEYIIILLWGIPCTILYNTLAGIVRSLGDSKTPVVFLVLSSILNIVLDIVFIASFNWGVAGAAIATVLSQGVSGVICLIYMIKKFDILKMEKDDWKVRPRILGNICYLGVPMGLQYSITAIGTVILQKAVNGLGSNAVAAITAGARLSCLFAVITDGLGVTMATFGGQNVGAGKIDRVRKGALFAFLMGVCFGVVGFLLIWFLSDYMLLAFLSADQTEILAMARLYLIIWIASFPLLTGVNVFRFTIQGMGYSFTAIIAGVLEMVARSAVAWLLVPAVGFVGACFAETAAWIAADAFLIPAFIICTAMLKKKIERRNKLQEG